jgi:hypothetical protein
LNRDLLAEWFVIDWPLSSLWMLGTAAPSQCTVARFDLARADLGIQEDLVRAVCLVDVQDASK